MARGTLAATACLLLAFVGGSAYAAPGDAIEITSKVFKGGQVTIVAKNTGTTNLLVVAGRFPAGTVVESAQSTQPVTVCGGAGPVIKNIGECFYGQGKEFKPGESRTVTFNLQQALKPGSDVQLCTTSRLPSSDDVCVTVEVPADEPCECQRLDVETKIVGGENTGNMQTWLISVRWQLHCRGEKGGCAAEVELLAPKRENDFVMGGTSREPARCRGTCNRVAKDSFVDRFRSAELAKRAIRKGQRYSLRIRTACIDDGKRVRQRIETMTFVYDKDGDLDRTKSDLNADGQPDGKKK